MAYKTPIMWLPFLNREVSSELNVENVEKPPHTPVVKKRYILLFVKENPEKSPMKNPISTAAKKLTINVVRGKVDLIGREQIKNLSTAPKNPPSPTNRQLFNKSISICVKLKHSHKCFLRNFNRA
jgi:hypothetical protein